MELHCIGDTADARKGAAPAAKSGQPARMGEVRVGEMAEPRKQRGGSKKAKSCLASSWCSYSSFFSATKEMGSQRKREGSKG